jgi:hypothetical protein
VDSTVAVAAAVALENPFDELAEYDVRALAGSRLGGVVVAAARDSENLADGPDAVAGLLMDVLDHRP